MMTCTLNGGPEMGQESSRQMPGRWRGIKVVFLKIIIICYFVWILHNNLLFCLNSIFYSVILTQFYILLCYTVWILHICYSVRILYFTLLFCLNFIYYFVIRPEFILYSIILSSLNFRLHSVILSEFYINIC